MFAIHGANEEDKLYSAVQAHGRKAANELIDYLNNLHSKANRKSTEQFLLGYERLVPGSNADLASWEKFLAEAFALMMVRLDQKPDPTLEVGKRLITLIREAAEFASPRLRAWDV